jgi:hypothetical protein
MSTCYCQKLFWLPTTAPSRATRHKKNYLLFSGTLQKDTILIPSAVTRATIHALNVRGPTSSSVSLFNHAAVVLVTLNNGSRYDPRTITPICFVAAARMVIADTKNIQHWRCFSTHCTHSGVTNLRDMTTIGRCDEVGYRGRV